MRQSPSLIHICMRPHEVVSWSEFKGNAPEQSCALDGYCSGPPEFDPTRLVVNFNHHEGVDRLGTRSTGAQVWVATLMGFRTTFPEPWVFVNDCDEDVSVAVFLLQHPELCRHPKLIELIQEADLLDSTMGLWPPRNEDMASRISWVFEPFRVFRASKILKKKPEDYLDVISQVGERIRAYLEGEAGVVEMNTRYDILFTGRSGIPVVRELGGSCRRQILQDGYPLWVAVRNAPDGHRAYTILKASQFVRPDLSRVQVGLNRAESEAGSTALWGGADHPGCIVMGSNRSRGSVLEPERVLEVIEEALGV